MKKYTLHFLIITILAGIFGFMGFHFPGEMAVRVLCLFAGIALMISCLDAVIVVRKKRKNRKQENKKN